MTKLILPTQNEVDNLFMKKVPGSSIRWSDALAYFRETATKTYSQDFVDDRCERGYLQVLYRSHISYRNEKDMAEDEDEMVKLKIAEILIRKSVSKVGGKNMAIELSAQDWSENCALHFLFGNVHHDNGISPTHIKLVMDLCHEINPHIYLIELCSIQNCNGLTPLHFLADQCASEAQHFVPSIIIRINEAMLFATDGNEEYLCQHPLMITDEDNDSALNIICQSEVEIDPELVGAFLGFLDEPYKETYELVFHEGQDGLTPVSDLLATFLDTYSDALNHFYTRHNFITGADEVMTFQSFLGSFDFMTNIPVDATDIIMLIERHLWPKMRILLEAAMKRNVHCRDKTSRDEVSVPDLPTHLASCVGNVPCFVLQIAYFIDPFSSNRLDNIGNTPLHWALIYSCTKEVKDHEEIDETAIIWRSKREEKSIVEYLLCREPSIVCTRDKYGRLPLHCAISNGCEFVHNIMPLLQLNPKHVWESDPTTHLKPFMLAAAHGEGDVCFYLLIIDPSVCTSCVFSCL